MKISSYVTYKVKYKLLTMNNL